MRSTKKTKILAIDPGTREMGVAVLENGNLMYHGVVSIKRRTSPHEKLRDARMVVSRMIRDFAPTVLVVEKMFFANNRNVALLNVFGDEIKALGKRHGLQVTSIAPSTVKKTICGNGRASKGEVARVIASKYPELSVYLTQDRKWKQKYHENMFDAVALGLTAIKDHKSGR